MHTIAANDTKAQQHNYSFLNVDPFPFTNANLTDPLNMPAIDDDDVYDAGIPFSKKTLSKVEKRAEHNAIERARRESLNSKFQQLAQALPNLMNYRRPSKSQIVEKALDWVKKSISREERYRYQVIQLQKENKQLLAQLMGNSSSPPPAIPSASLSTPTTTKHRQQPTVPTFNTSPASALSSIQQPFRSSTNTTITDIPTPRQPFLCNSPWLPAQQDLSPTSHLPLSLASPLDYSMDDLHTFYDSKHLDSVLFQSQSTDLYLDTMMDSSNCIDTKPSPSPGFILPMASKSTPAFSSVYRK